MNTFFQVIFSNIFFASLLAGSALLIERFWKKPMLAYILWLLVFVKLISPSFVPIYTYNDSLLGGSKAPPGIDISTTVAPTEAVDPRVVLASESISKESGAVLWPLIGKVFCILWLLGSVFFFVRSFIQVYRFNQLLSQERGALSSELRLLAEKLQKQLAIKKKIHIRVTRARLSPLVWWAGGRVQIIIPQTLIENMELQELRWVLSHELAHVRRRDYWVRWLEWGAFICFWWNPLVWLGKDHLRANEEICCDELVLSTMKGNPYHYANSLLNAVEQLTSIVRAPVTASEMNSGGFLERRLRMIVSGTSYSTTRIQRFSTLLLAALVLPLACLAEKTKDILPLRSFMGVDLGTQVQTPDVSGQCIPFIANEKCVDISAAVEKRDWNKLHELVASITNNVANIHSIEIDGMLKVQEIASKANCFVFTNIYVPSLASSQLSTNQIVELQNRVKVMVAQIQKEKSLLENEQLALKKQMQSVHAQMRIDLERLLRAQGLSDEVILKALREVASNNSTTIQIVIDPQKQAYPLPRG